VIGTNQRWDEWMLVLAFLESYSHENPSTGEKARRRAWKHRQKHKGDALNIDYPEMDSWCDVGGGHY
jgi:hypothetical protein